jgi:hypothetical protein
MGDNRIGHKLRGLDFQIELNGITPRELAVKMGYSEGYNVNITKWRNLQTGATLESIRKLSTALNCKPHHLTNPPNIAESIQYLTLAIAKYTHALLAENDRG